MRFIPYENITYESPLSPAEIQTRLAEVTESKKYFRKKNGLGNKDWKPYEGRVFEDSFRVRRLIAYKNSFLPQINGSIETHATGSKISVKMGLHPIILVIVILMTCIPLIVVSSLFFRPFQIEIVFAIVMLLSIYLLVIGAFKVESKKSMKFFVELLEAEIV